MNMSIKKDVEMFRDVMAAGFSLSNVQSVNTDDGSCWSTVLVCDKRKILRASNGGFGGPDEIQQLVTKDRGFRDLSPAAAQIDRLMAVPSVAAFVKNYDIELEEGCWHYAVERVHKEREQAGGTQTIEQVRAELEAESKKKVEAIKSSPAKRDDETVAMVIGALTDTRSEIQRMKRTCKTKLAWFKKGSGGSEYVSLSIPDSPANRARAESKYLAEMDGYVNDLVMGL
jgi:hypothetical protein